MKRAHVNLGRLDELDVAALLRFVSQKDLYDENIERMVGHCAPILSSPPTSSLAASYPLRFSCKLFT
jgi:hypothetical protein